MSEVSAPEVSSPEMSTNEAPQSAPAPTSDKRKLKIDGAEVEVDVDEVLKDYTKYKGSEKRFEEAAKLRKEAERAMEDRRQIEYLLENATKGDLNWLKQIVPKEMLTKWAEQELLEHIEWEQKPQMERELIAERRRREALESQINEATQTKQREEATKVEEQAYQQIEQDIVTAVKDLGYDMKVTPRFIRRISEQMLASLEASGNDPNVKFMPAKMASERAFRGLKVDAQELLGLLSPEEVVGMLPPKIREAIRKADVDQVLSQMPSGIRKSDELDVGPTKSKLKRMTTDEYFSRLEAGATKRR